MRTHSFTVEALLEEELRFALTSLQPFLLKRSWLSIRKKDSEIGVGGFGIVHRAELRKRLLASKTVVAVKKLYSVGDREKRLRTALDLTRELTVWAKLDHPNVLRLLGFHLSVDLNEAWLVSPYAINGNIVEYLDRVPLVIHDRLELAKDTAKGLEYLHTRTPPVCHGDIKSVNVLVNKKGRAMLCDFGLAKTIDRVSWSRTKSAPGGTTRFCSPELFLPDSRPTLESDVWAWSCLLLEITTGRVPYSETQLEGRVIHQILEKVTPAQLDDVMYPTHVREMLGRCWQHEPDERPKMAEIVALLSAGNLRFAHEGRFSSPPMTDPTDQNDGLERELANALAPLQRYSVKPVWLAFPKMNSMLGVGGYGTVHRAVMRRYWRDASQEVAVKKLKSPDGVHKSLRMAIALIRELSVWAGLKHDNIIPFIGFYLSENYGEAWLISPFIPYGNLMDYIEGNQPQLSERMILAIDTCQGLKYLHTRNPPICHGDIKSLNVLINQEHRAVLCDFGLAKAMESLPTGLTTSTFNQGGSLPYESPELLLEASPRTLQSDIWAWGCLLQEIFSGKVPYYWAVNPGAIVKWIIQNTPPALLDEFECPRLVRRLLKYCWTARPEARPTIEQCLLVLSGTNTGIPFEDDAEASENPILKELEGVRGSGSIDHLLLDRSSVNFIRTEPLTWPFTFGPLYYTTLRPEDGSETPVAVRRIVPTKRDTTAQLEEEKAVLDSVKSWSELKHPNLAEFIGYCKATPDGEILLVHRFYSHGRLEDHLRPGISRMQQLDMATDIADALLYLHSQVPAIYHGNLHPGNILISEAGRAIVSDFGLDAIKRHTPVKEPPLSSLRYRNPEAVVTSAAPSARGDLVTNIDPHFGVETKSDLLAAWDRKELPGEILTLLPRTQNILGMCWKWAPESRPNIGELVSVLSGRLFRFEPVMTIPEKRVERLKFSPSGRYLLMRETDKGIVMYDTTSWVTVDTVAYENEEGKARFLQMSVSERYLTVVTFGPAVLVWDMNNRCSPPEAFKGHTGGIWAIAISPSDRFVASVSEDGTLRLWYLHENGDAHKAFQTRTDARSLAIAPGETTAAIGFERVGVQLVSLADGSILAVLSEGYVWSIAFSSDGSRIYGGCVETTIICWEVEYVTRPDGTTKSKVRSQSIRGHRNIVSTLSANDSWIVSISDDGDVRVTNLVINALSNHSIGKVPRSPIQGCMDVSPLTSQVSGFVAGAGNDPNAGTVIYKFASWDQPGAYLV